MLQPSTGRRVLLVGRDGRLVDRGSRPRSGVGFSRLARVRVRATGPDNRGVSEDSGGVRQRPFEAVVPRSGERRSGGPAPSGTPSAGWLKPVADPAGWRDRPRDREPTIAETLGLEPRFQTRPCHRPHRSWIPSCPRQRRPVKAHHDQISRRHRRTSSPDRSEPRRHRAVGLCPRQLPNPRGLCSSDEARRNDQSSIPVVSMPEAAPTHRAKSEYHSSHASRCPQRHGGAPALAAIETRCCRACRPALNDRLVVLALARASHRTYGTAKGASGPSSPQMPCSADEHVGSADGKASSTDVWT
jgi:hypothetical protein